MAYCGLFTDFVAEYHVDEHARYYIKYGQTAQLVGPMPKPQAKLMARKTTVRSHDYRMAVIYTLLRGQLAVYGVVINGVFKVRGRSVAESAVLPP